MLKSLRRIGLLLIWAVLGLIAAPVARLILDGVYDILHSADAAAFPHYNPILQKAEYAVFDGAMSALSYLFASAVAVYCSIVTDNSRYEMIISKTDGLYDIGDGIRLYAEPYLTADILASLTVAAVFSIPLPFIPDRIFGLTVARPLLVPRAICSLLEGFSGAVVGGGIMLACLLLAHAIAIPLSVCAWRARWLTAFAEGEG